MAVAMLLGQRAKLAVEAADAIDCPVERGCLVVQLLKQGKLLFIASLRRAEPRVLGDQQIGRACLRANRQFHTIRSGHDCRAGLRVRLVGQRLVLLRCPGRIDAAPAPDASCPRRSG